MERVITEITALAAECECGNPHNRIPIEKVIVQSGALEEAVGFLRDKQFTRLAIIADSNTFEAAGRVLESMLERAGLSVKTILIKPDQNNDVVADELSLVQALLDMPPSTDAILAVGSGTLHDIARFCSAKTKIPFISIPTAASVDGFTSLGAPLLIRGVKTTFQMVAPIAVFADLNIVTKAPRKMAAAGFGNMLAKFTSLADWRFSHLTAGEPYCPLAARITAEALGSCVEYKDEITAGNQKGIRILIEALIKSGYAMLLFGQSHPASGGEHHLSHYWEMEFIKQHRPAVLHGAKVGVSTVLLSHFYKKEFLPALENLAGQNAEGDRHLQYIQKHSDEIRNLYESIPGASALAGMLEAMGAEARPEQLGIDEALVAASLLHAQNLRNRFTALKFLNEYAPERVRLRKEG